MEITRRFKELAAAPSEEAREVIRKRILPGDWAHRQSLGCTAFFVGSAGGLGVLNFSLVDTAAVTVLVVASVMAIDFMVFVPRVYQRQHEHTRQKL